MAPYTTFDTASPQSPSLLLLLLFFRFKLIQLSQCRSFAFISTMAFRHCFYFYPLVAHSLHYTVHTHIQVSVKKMHTKSSTTTKAQEL